LCPPTPRTHTQLPILRGGATRWSLSPTSSTSPLTRSCAGITCAAEPSEQDSASTSPSPQGSHEANAARAMDGTAAAALPHAAAALAVVSTPESAPESAPQHTAAAAGNISAESVALEKHTGRRFRNARHVPRRLPSITHSTALPVASFPVWSLVWSLVRSLAWSLV
jgi:hypothetical protein